MVFRWPWWWGGGWCHTVQWPASTGDQHRYWLTDCGITPPPPTLGLSDFQYSIIVLAILYSVSFILTSTLLSVVLAFILTLTLLSVVLAFILFSTLVFVVLAFPTSQLNIILYRVSFHIFSFHVPMIPKLSKFVPISRLFCPIKRQTTQPQVRNCMNWINQGLEETLCNNYQAGNLSTHSSNSPGLSCFIRPTN